jgi:hypothetical protein
MSKLNSFILKKTVTWTLCPSKCPSYRQVLSIRKVGFLMIYHSKMVNHHPAPNPFVDLPVQYEVCRYYQH